MPLDLVAKLTRWQVYNLYFCERDDNGNPAPDEAEAFVPPTERELFERWGKANRLPAWLIERRWAERKR